MRRRDEKYILCIITVTSKYLIEERNVDGNGKRIVLHTLNRHSNKGPTFISVDIYRITRRRKDIMLTKVFITARAYEVSRVPTAMARSVSTDTDFRQNAPSSVAVEPLSIVQQDEDGIL